MLLCYVVLLCYAAVLSCCTRLCCYAGLCCPAMLCCYAMLLREGCRRYCYAILCCYAMLLCYAMLPCYAMRGTALPTRLRLCYAVSGTELAYGSVGASHGTGLWGRSGGVQGGVGEEGGGGWAVRSPEEDEGDARGRGGAAEAR
eukprot:1428228-Rhodomonas_salina.1